jgi:DNA-binding beta-propeller fold protein YncE
MMDRRTFVAAAAGAPFAAVARRAHAGLLGGTPLALVTADLESRLVASNLATGRVVREVQTAPGPRSIESIGGSTAVVAHTESGAVSIVDGANLRVRTLLHGFSEPRYTAADRGGRFAFVTDSGRGDIALVDVMQGVVVRRLALGGPARHVSLSPSGQALWVALGTKAEELALIDLRAGRLRLVRRLRPPFLAHDVGFAPAGNAVWVTSGDRGELVVYDAARLGVRFRVAADAPPQHVTFIGERAYVTSGDDGTLRVHDAADGRLLRLTRVPVGSYNVQQGWGVVLTPSLEQGTLCVLRSDGRMLRESRVARSSHDACFVMSR